MHFSKTIRGVKFIGVTNGQPVVVFPEDKILIGAIPIPIGKDDDFLIEGNVLEKYKGDNAYIYKDGAFIPFNSRYRYFCFLSENEVVSNEHVDGLSRLSIIEQDNEYLIDIDETNLADSVYIAQKKGDYAIFLSHNSLSLLFYTKIGQRLWEYKEEDVNLKINGRCIPVVGDVVVVISEYCAIARKIQGFNIRTGEKLWEIPNAEEIVCPNTFFVGEDQHLYGCCTECAYYDEESKLIMTKLNPKNGNVESVEVGMGYSVMSYDVTMHDRQLYYIDNRPGNEIGVIDVDMKELVERVPLNIKKKVTIGAPVVTDDKVYVFIRDLKELRVFEK
jgi:hypothetical protein